MDRLIERFDVVIDDDLHLCPHRGVAYQRNMRKDRVPYDANYLKKVRAYESTDTARLVNTSRRHLIERHWRGSLLDFGAGSGAFIKNTPAARGYDIEQLGEELKASGLYEDHFENYDAFSAWDVIEHLEDPEHFFDKIKRDAHLFVSIPVFSDLWSIRRSKHYRPGEHLYYWTERGFVDWMAQHGFRHLETCFDECAVGREAIAEFAFKRDIPNRAGFVDLYRRLHRSKHYGSTAGNYLEAVSVLVEKLKPKSIIDYGCGRSDLANCFWLDGQRRVAKYDPAIDEFMGMPEGIFDLALCIDVMEHVPMAEVDAVLSELRTKSATVAFVISLAPARATLPDGRNAHVTLMTRGEWVRWIAKHFGPEVEALPTKWPSEIMLVACDRRAAIKLKEAA